MERGEEGRGRGEKKNKEAAEQRKEGKKERENEGGREGREKGMEGGREEIEQKEITKDGTATHHPRFLRLCAWNIVQGLRACPAPTSI